VFTILTVPKPFRGHIGDIQRNAVESWRALHPDVQVVLVGDEEGVKEAARDAGVDHAAGLARNARGTPRLDSAFECAAGLSRWPLWCFVNADILLLDDFPQAVARVSSRFREFLIVGESRDLQVKGHARPEDPAGLSELRARALRDGRLRGYAALDYFVFYRGFFDPVPPFLIGRACFDNWLVWRARERHFPVIDVTRGVVVVHQSHDYSHVAGGLDEAYYGEEARYNESLAGGRDHIYSLHEATHRLYRHGPPQPYLSSIFRMREKARLARVSATIHIGAWRERKTALQTDGRPHPLRLLGVFPAPNPETTVLLDRIAEGEDVDLDVVYPTSPEGPSMLAQHVHWFARTTRLARLDRLLGREYPITWTIWHSFYFLRPDCMLIAGLSTFPAQAAVAWCIAWRVPYLLLAEDREHATPPESPLRRAVLLAVAQRSVAVLSLNGRDTNRHERVRHLPGATEESVAAILDLARRARDARLRREAQVPRLGYRALTWVDGRITRRARTRQSHSASAGRRE